MVPSKWARLWKRFEGVPTASYKYEGPQLVGIVLYQTPYVLDRCPYGPMITCFLLQINLIANN